MKFWEACYEIQRGEEVVFTGRTLLKAKNFGTAREEISAFLDGDLLRPSPLMFVITGLREVTL